MEAVVAGWFTEVRWGVVFWGGGSGRLKSTETSPAMVIDISTRCHEMHYTRLRFCKVSLPHHNFWNPIHLHQTKLNGRHQHDAQDVLPTPFGCFILYNHYHLPALPLYKHHQPAATSFYLGSHTIMGRGKRKRNTQQKDKRAAIRQSTFSLAQKEPGKPTVVMNDEAFKRLEAYSKTWVEFEVKLRK